MRATVQPISRWTAARPTATAGPTTALTLRGVKIQELKSMPLSKRIANFGHHTNRPAFAGQSEFQVQSFAHRKRLGKHAADAAQSDISRAAAEGSGSPRARNRQRNVDRESRKAARHLPAGGNLRTSHNGGRA